MSKHVSKHMEGPLHPHITCRYPLEHTDAQGSIGDIQGVFEHMEASDGVSECTGGVQTYGGVWTSPMCEYM